MRERNKRNKKRRIFSFIFYHYMHPPPVLVLSSRCFMFLLRLAYRTKCWRASTHHTPPASATLLKVWQLHRRIKCYIALSVIATVVDLAIGVGGVIYLFHRQHAPTLIVATWTMRCAANE